jgi:hypothetical protein
MSSKILLQGRSQKFIVLCNILAGDCPQPWQPQPQHQQEADMLQGPATPFSKPPHFCNALLKLQIHVQDDRGVSMRMKYQFSVLCTNSYLTNLHQSNL